MLIKRSILILSILQFGILAFGQGGKENTLNQNSNKVNFTSKKNKKIGVTFQVSNPSTDNIKLSYFGVSNESKDNFNIKREVFATGFFLSYNLQPETEVRFRFGITKYSIEKYNSDYYGWDIHFSGRQTKWHFAPGIVWKIGNRKFSPFVGFEVPINIHGEYNFKSVRYDDFYAVTSIVRSKIPKGYSFGVGAVMGFNYYPLAWLSFGAEYSPSLLYAKLSGETTVNYGYGYDTYSHDKDQGETYYEQRFSINLSLWF